MYSNRFWRGEKSIIIYKKNWLRKNTLDTVYSYIAYICIVCVVFSRLVTQQSSRITASLFKVALFSLATVIPKIM